MHLSSISIEGLRKIKKLTVGFRPGLNILVGPNNTGKTTIVDALRALLSTTDEGALRVFDSDLHIDANGKPSAQIEIRYVFSGLTVDEEACFLPALKPTHSNGGGPAEYEAHFAVRYSTADSSGRLRAKRWCGEHEENGMTGEMLEGLRATYLPPLRNPASGLYPSRSSQIARLAGQLSTEQEKQDLVQSLKDFDAILSKASPVEKTKNAIASRHAEMLGAVLAQALAIGLAPPDFQRMVARLSLSIENLDVEQNGLGYNNLIYMAVVLSELSLNPEAEYKALIVEEPEAHLHPQLQAVLLQYFQSKENPQSGGEQKQVQVFVTSHSPNFASIANIDTVLCIQMQQGDVVACAPRNVTFDSGKKEKLQRYLDVTRAELFFANRIILVEGTAELFMLTVCAAKAGLDLRKNAISVLSTDGLNFDSFTPLFGKHALATRVAVVSDADPTGFPKLGDDLVLSSAATKLRAAENEYVKCFFAYKTFEYDLALHPENHEAMLFALEDIHPTMAKALRAQVEQSQAADRAQTLFVGMFDRPDGKTNVRKGAYAQALASRASKDGATLIVPPYIQSALKFIAEG